jgi:hypothetical protein
VIAMTGMVPRMGDVVSITAVAACQFVDSPIRRFRIIEAEPIADRPGWCRIRGWDLDTVAQEYVQYDVLVDGLIIRPGHGWKQAWP